MIPSAAEYHMRLNLDQLDATNLESSTSNSVLGNFEDVPVLNTVGVIDMETTTPSTSSATEDVIVTVCKATCLQTKTIM